MFKGLKIYRTNLNWQINTTILIVELILQNTSALDARSLNFGRHLIIGRLVSLFRSRSSKVPAINKCLQLTSVQESKQPHGQWRRRDRGKSFRFARSWITRSEEGNRQLVRFSHSEIYLYEFPQNVTNVWRKAVVNSLPTDSVSCHSREYSRCLTILARLILYCEFHERI